MNESWSNAPEDVLVNVVLPKQKDYKIVAVSDPAIVTDNIDNEYEKKVRQNIDMINRQWSALERDRNSLSLEIESLIQSKEPVEYDGQRIYRLFHSLGGSGQQQAIDLFRKFNKQGGTYLALDIETFGDSQDRMNPYGVSEIAINEYDAEGNLVSRKYNGFLRQRKDVVDDLAVELQRIRADKYYYNTLPEYKKRSIVDLMRYSTHMDGADANAFSTDGGIRHHSIIDSVFDHKDQVDHRKVIQHMDHYLPYMESGLETVGTKGTAAKTAMDKVAEIIRQNQEKFIVTYNGNIFDMPVLQAYAIRVGSELPSDIKHLDYLNVIRSTYMDSDVLKRKVNPDYAGSPYGKDKLAAFRELLPDGNQADAHSASVDTDDTAKVVAITRQHIQDEIESNKIAIREGFHLHPAQMTWSDAELHHGHQLFASGGVMAYQDGDESFRMAWDPDENKWVQTSSGFNKTVINSKSFYHFAGVEDLTGDGNVTKLAFRFYDPDRDEVAYIVRQGDNAFQELQDFVQSRFYNWDNVDAKTREEITHVAETDRARRRYDRFFSMDGGGRGLSVDADGNIIERGTAGFSGLKRMLSNAEVMRDYLDSKGQPYRDRVAQYRAEGMTESQAKRAARLVLQEELMDELNFESLWNPEAKRYETNVRERDAFFKMYGRLIDELPYLNQAVNEIDKVFNEDINRASKIPDVYNRRQALKEINQRRDMALMNYYQQLSSSVGLPKAERVLMPFESHRLKYFDPEVGDYRTLNFETVGSARSSIYSYARRGVEENHPNRQRVMRERANHLIENLYSQGIVTKGERNQYQNILASNDSVWSASEEIAGHMRNRSGGLYETTRVEPSITSNEPIQKVSMEQNRSFIQRAIQDTENAHLIINMNLARGKQLELSEQLRHDLRVLDETRFSHLQPNNYKALEELITSMRRADPASHIAVVMDGSSSDGGLKIYAYDGVDSISVQNQLARGTRPVQALEIDMPLINKGGTHKIGGRVINAHSMAVYEDGKINMISSAQYIARGYGDRMGQIARLRREGKIEEANKLARRTLSDQVSNMSGIQRNIVGGPNDSYSWANNLSDELKQSHVKLGNAMVEDFFYNGYDGIKLTREDFYDPDDVFITRNGQEVLRRGVELSDVNMNTQHKMLMKMTKWAEDRLGEDHPDFKVFTSSLKAEHVAAGTVSMVDIRHMVPYGAFYNHGRDNMVQYMNAYVINEATEDRLQGLRGVDRNRLLETERYFESGRGNIGVNMKTAFMTQDQLRARIDEMFATESGRKLLGEVGLLTESGELNHLKLPRLYEQQGIIAQDVADALTVDNEKRYAKGQLFEIDDALHSDRNIAPGQRLGIRIHDNGYREEVFYEGTRPARLISGMAEGEDLLVRWETDPFKIMLDGEKMTDSPVDRRFIQALTGQDDIAVIINPNVLKHRDYGMLMSGEARLLAEHIRNETNEKRRNRMIRTIESAGLGLEWNHNEGMFIDKSFQVGTEGIDIDREAFDKVFKELGIKNTTRVGDYRVGILEAHLSKVENYSKVIDATGHRVIDYEEGYNAATGEYEVRRTYGGRDGVQWGHREMGVLKGQGMKETYKHVHRIMVEQGLERPDGGIGRLEESRNIAQSLKYMTEEERFQIQALSTGDFESLPEQHRNKFTYQGTIFNREAVESAVERQIMKHGSSAAGAMNQHGFWLQLPTVELSDGQLGKVTVNMTGDITDPKEINKIFIPFTNVEGANGDTHLRSLQKQIANIYEKADAVTRAGSIQEARAVHDDLQIAVRGYVKQSFQELSASTGMLFGDAFKTAMGGEVDGIQTSSASGLFKLMDFETSIRYGDGQHTVISEEMAKKMGIYDQLKSGKELYVANVRYPTFHDGAMQFTKLHMSVDVKDGEIHTTSFSSMLQNADSDGDYSHIVVMDDDKIQREWKQAHDTVDDRFQARWKEHRMKEDPAHPDFKGYQMEGASIHGTLPETDEQGRPIRNIPRDIGNTEEEMASKVGKMTIGRASNLNLFMRQVADRMYENDSETRNLIKEFGRGIEQKLIDAKHGAEPVGLQMIDHIYRGEWDKAMLLDEQKFGSMFQEEYKMARVAEVMPEALNRLRTNLHSQGMKFGTSTGLSTKYGIQNFIDLLYGNADPSDFGGDNNALAMWHKYLIENEGMDIDRFGHGEQLPPIERLTQTPMLDRVEEGRSRLNRARNIATDFVGGGISDFGGKVKDMFTNMSGRRAALLGAGLAVAGIAGYNILNTDKPEMPYNNSGGATEYQEPQPAIETGAGYGGSTQNASIQVSASGGKVSQDQLSHAVSQGMRDSQMTAGPTRVSINYQDNTQQLNRQWYRDKVRENI